MSEKDFNGRFKSYQRAQQAAERILWTANMWTANGPLPSCTKEDFSDDAQPTQYQIAACRALCEYSLRMTEVVDYEQRLQALEDEMRR